MNSKNESAHRSGNYDRRGIDVSTTPFIADTPKHNDSIPSYAPEQIERGHKVYARFLRWREDNPTAYKYAESTALKLCKSGKRVGAQQLVELIRGKDFCDVDGNPTRTNNSYRSILARVLIIDHPELMEYIELRESVFDVIIRGPKCS